MIEHYRFGQIRVNGKEYTGDIKIVSGRVVAGWWRKEGHELALSDVLDILEAAPRTLVVGMGEPGYMKVAGALRRHLAGAGISLVEEPTAQAVQTFNSLYGSGADVAGAFHLTC